jgi:AAA domain
MRWLLNKEGRLRPDWQGLESQFNRRSQAFQLLKRGTTCLPSLNKILPDGVKADAPGQDFSPLVRPVYDPHQKEAIRKALVPGTLTTILGPPGTGKTDVIAEVAAQIAKRGGRVLVSSQTHLAVDNALKRLEKLDYIFAVRIGNPLSSKLKRFPRSHLINGLALSKWPPFQGLWRPQSIYEIGSSRECCGAVSEENLGEEPSSIE